MGSGNSLVSVPAAVVTGGEVPTASSSKPSFQCPHCDKEPYSNRQNMNRHVLTKHKNVKYSCPICAKPLGRSDNLKVHMEKKHSDKKSN